MEFEKDDPITEEARILAQTKKVVLQPADPFLKLKDTPDPIVTTETHANIERDSENTTNASYLAESSQPAHHPALKVGMIVAASLIVGIAGGAGYFMFIG